MSESDKNSKDEKAEAELDVVEVVETELEVEGLEVPPVPAKPAVPPPLPKVPAAATPPAAPAVPLPPVPAAAAPVPPVPAAGAPVPPVPGAGAPVPPAPGVGAPVPPVPGAGMPQPVLQPGVQYVQAPVAQPNPFVMALSNLWFVQNDIWKGKVRDAYKRPEDVTAVTRSTWQNWVIPFLAVSLAVALLIPAWIGRAYAVTVSSAGGYVSSHVSVGVLAMAFFMGLLITFMYLTLRTVAVLLAARVSGDQNLTFTQSATLVAVPQTIVWLPVMVSFLLVLLIPFLSLFPISIGIPGVLLMVEIVTYTGLTRAGHFTRSPLVAYVWFAMAAMTVASIVGFPLLITALAM